MSMTDIPDVEKDPSIGVSYNVQIAGSKSLVLQTFVARDADIAALNAALDKMRVAAERQAAFAALVDLQKELKQNEEFQARHAERMAQVDENLKAAWGRGNRKGDIVLTAKERTEQQQAYANAEELKRIHAKLVKSIADVEATIGA